MEAQIKKNHHYVWKHYLNRWGDKEIYHNTPKGKAVPYGTKGLASLRGFYKIDTATNEDLTFLMCLFKNIPEDLVKNHNSFFKDIIEKKDSEQENIDVYKFNTIEDKYSKIEESVKEVINKLSAGDDSILNDEYKKDSFLYFLAHQKFRTKKFKDIALGLIKENLYVEDEQTTKKYINLHEKNWCFLSYLMGHNFGRSLISEKEKEKHIFLTNNTNTPFITSDNPVINIHPNSFSNSATVDSMVLYFPISPMYAYIIFDENNSFGTINNPVKESEVKKLNERIAKKAHTEIFSSNEATIKENIQYI